MGLMDLFRSGRVETTRAALEEARDPGTASGAVDRLVTTLLDIGIDGKGPFKSAATVARRARSRSGSSQAAIDRVARKHVAGGALGGFATGFGGFFTMVVALPLNVLEFYLQATRMVAATAELRGYDLNRPEVRSATLLTLAGEDAGAVLAKAGLGTVTGGTVTGLLRQVLPKSGLMLLNKAVGFRLLRTAGGQLLARLGRAVPVVGGFLGAALDAYLMHRIGQAAKREFPKVD